MSEMPDKIAGLALMALVLCCSSVRAADTLEPFAVGLSDAEVYLGFEGVGPTAKNAYGELVLGFGLLERLTFLMGGVVQHDPELSATSGELYAAMMGTVLDTDHLDLDLVLELRFTGEALDRPRVTPMLELNLDRRPDMSSWGLYLRAGVPLQGRESPAGGAWQLALQVENTVGAYRTMGRHQLLLEYDMAFDPSPLAEQLAVTVGGLALGYNVTINDQMELISQIYLDLPQQNQPLTANLMLGMIFTLPG